MTIYTIQSIQHGSTHTGMTEEQAAKFLRCKDCKFTDGERPIADGRYWCELHSSFMYFCSDAERRDDCVGR